MGDDGGRFNSSRNGLASISRYEGVRDMWEVDYSEGSWQAAFDGNWLPNCYSTKEEAMKALLDHMAELLCEG